MTVRNRIVNLLHFYTLVPTLLLLIVLVPVRSIQAQRSPARAEAVFSDAYQLYADQLYAPATEAFYNFRHTYPSHPNAAEALYYEAESALALGRVETSVNLFRTFQQQYPAHPLALRARLALGQYFYEEGDFQRTIDTLQEVIADGAPPAIAARALYAMGEASEQLGRTELALGYYRRAANDYIHTPTAPLALYAIAYIHVENDDSEDAVDAFELLKARYPDSPYVRNIGLALAEVYYDLSDYQGVIDEVDERLPQLEDAARERATFLLAESYNQLRDTDNAIIYYKRFTEAQPDSPYYRRARYGLAWSYYFAKVYEKAAENFAYAREGYSDDLAMQATYYEAVNRKLLDQDQAAIDLFEEVAERWASSDLADHAVHERGLLLYELRRWEEAQAAFTRLIDTYVYSDLIGEALRLRGYTSIALSDFDDALRDFDQAIEMDAAPDELKEQIAFQKAWLLYRTGNYNQSAPAFLELYEQNPNSYKAGESLFWAAESYYQNGDLNDAARLFQLYQRDQSSGQYADAVSYALGWVYFKQGRYGDAAIAFRSFLNAYRDEDNAVPYRTDAQLRLADSYYALKRYGDAVQAYRAVGEGGGDYALYQVGKAYSNAGQVENASNIFRELLASYPDSNWREESMYTLGYLYFQNQQYDQAINMYEELIGTYPRDPLAAKAQYGIGDALFNAERLEASIRAYSIVLERYPNSPFVSDAASSIQYALLALDDKSRAEAVIDSFVTSNPNSPIASELRFRQAEVKYQSGNLDEAFSAFQNFIQTQRNAPLIPDAYFYLGRIEADRGNPDKAAEAYGRVVRFYADSPRRPEAARQLGKLLLGEKRPAEALEVFRQMELMNPNDTRLLAEARYGQGQSLLALGRLSEAEQLLSQAAEAAPDAPESASAVLGLAKVYEQQNRPGEAMLLYRQVAERSQDAIGAEALYLLGALLHRRGELQAAIAQLSRLPTLFSTHLDWVARGYLLQARAFNELGQSGEAARIYDRIIDEYAGTPFAEQATREKEAL